MKSHVLFSLFLFSKKNDLCRFFDEIPFLSIHSHREFFSFTILCFMLDLLGNATLLLPLTWLLQFPDLLQLLIVVYISCWVRLRRRLFEELGQWSFRNLLKGNILSGVELGKGRFDLEVIQYWRGRPQEIFLKNYRSYISSFLKLRMFLNFSKFFYNF